MYISVSDAKAQLTDLMRRAEAGDEVILTRHGHPAVRLVSIKVKRSVEDKLKFLEDISRSGRSKATSGVCAARSQDFLYNKDGLPE